MYGTSADRAVNMLYHFEEECRIARRLAIYSVCGFGFNGTSC